MTIIREINLYFLITIYEENFSIKHGAISQQKARDIYHTFVMMNVAIFTLPYFSKINGDPLTPNMCISTNSNISNHIQNSMQVISQLTYHNNTFAKSTLIILFVKCQNNSKKKKAWRKKRRIQKHFIFNMKSS
jgi:hypothetical protein